MHGFTDLALTVREHLVPYLPLLIEGTLKGIGKSTGEITVKEIWGKLEHKLNAKNDARQAVANIVAKPDSKARQEVFQEELEALLIENPDLAQELIKILEESVGSVNINQSISGNNNQTIGQMSGGKVIGKVAGNINLGSNHD
jgi:hypothetical protein